MTTRRDTLMGVVGDDALWKSIVASAAGTWTKTRRFTVLPNSYMVGEGYGVHEAPARVAKWDIVFSSRKCV